MDAREGSSGVCASRSRCTELWASLSRQQAIFVGDITLGEKWESPGPISRGAFRTYRRRLFLVLPRPTIPRDLWGVHSVQAEKPHHSLRVGGEHIKPVYLGRFLASSRVLFRGTRNPRRNWLRRVGIRDLETKLAEHDQEKTNI